jgi:hypothetical protein
MAAIPELLDGHLTLGVEGLELLYLNGYIGKLASGLRLVMFMRDQLGKPVPSPAYGSLRHAVDWARPRRSFNSGPSISREISLPTGEFHIVQDPRRLYPDWTVVPK